MQDTKNDLKCGESRGIVVKALALHKARLTSSIKMQRGWLVLHTAARSFSMKRLSLRDQKPHFDCGVLSALS